MSDQNNAGEVETLKARIAQHEETITALKEEAKILEAWKIQGQSVPAELEETVRQKIAAGLEPEQALEVAKAQHFHDAHLMRTQPAK